jgi:hypothetical protein
MTLGSFRDQAVAQFAYIAGSIAMVAIAYLLAPANHRFWAVFGMAIFLSLGLLGLITFPFLVLPLIFLFAPTSEPSALAPVIIVPVTVGTAILNILITYGLIAIVMMGWIPLLRAR